MPYSDGSSPEQAQHDAFMYFRTLIVPEGVDTEVWAVDEDCGEKCLDPKCVKFGFVHIADRPYCVGHASIVILGMPDGVRRHVAIDVGRPVLALKVEAPKVVDTVVDFLRFVVRQKGSTVTVDMARRATGLASLLEKGGEQVRNT